jgi:hypothetical protein
MKLTYVIAFALALCVVFGCRGKNKVMETPPVQETKKINFVPPADSMLTLGQIKKMKDCDGLLDSLSIFYRDSFKTKDAVLLSRFQDDFTKAQDKICLRGGLAGGFTEYLWIVKNLGNPKNGKLLDSLKMKVY